MESDVTIEDYEINGIKIKLVFTHTPDFTVCAVVSNRDGKVTQGFLGFARRHPREQDDPEMGKKVALRKALGVGLWWSGGQRADERELWHEYRLRHNPQYSQKGV